ncbi:hypothetical protein N665_1188s0011 [Sinapis alba]|nr:hypothetical protein N665_1188s0011 [Sinapis alba]
MKKILNLKQFLVILSDACLCIKHVESNEIQDSDTDIKKGFVCVEDESVFAEKANVGGRRIKVVITRKQLNLLLAKQVSLEQLGFMNQRMFLRSFRKDKWKPLLESIHETPEL